MLVHCWILLFRERPTSDETEPVTLGMKKRGVTPNLGVGGFGPTADGKVVFGDYAKRRAEGNFIKVVSRIILQSARV
jgi:hypothetical protein